MRIAFIFPPMLVGGRPVDFHHVWDAPRGLTGSEAHLLCTAKELAARGHECVMHIEAPNAAKWEGVHLADSRAPVWSTNQFDVVAVSLDCNALRDAPPDALRVCFQQCNDFSYGQPGWRDWTDLIVLPSEPHRTMFTTHPRLHHLGGHLPPEKVDVVPNGCYPEEYEVNPQRKRGRCVSISSPDRGAHLILQEWLPIRAKVPWATLRVFYYSLESFLNDWRGKREEPSWPVGWKEWCRRSQYMDRAFVELAPHGVTKVGSVSRQQLVRELAEAELVLYPCDTIDWTESFSCATLEGCAAGAVPVIAGTDCLGEVYGAACPCVPEPARKNMDAWRELVVRALTDQPFLEDYRARGLALAKEYSWGAAAEKMERVFEKRLEEKRCRKSQLLSGAAVPGESTLP